MTHKLSATKVSKILSLYFAGNTETDIASKLKVAQSTVSMYVSQFNSLVEQYGLEVAAHALGITHEVDELHSLAAELKDGYLTVPEAIAGLNTHIALWKLGISPEKYKDLVHASTKMKDGGYLEAALKLSNLEHSTGMSYHEIVSEFEAKHKKLEEANNELQGVKANMTKFNNELADLQKQKEIAAQSLKEQLDKLGLNMSRLTLVEGLALALKDGGISDSQISTYVARQKLLDKYDISLNNLVTIVKEAKVMTADDEGKALAEKLSELGSLDAAIEACQNKLTLLTEGTAGLEEKAKVKAKIEADIVKLKAERTAHETVVAELATTEKKLAEVQHNVAELLYQQEALTQDINKKEELRGHLDEEIGDKEKKVSDLSELEAKRDDLALSISETEAKLSNEKSRLQIFDSFLGFVSSSSIGELEKFVGVLPSLLDSVKQGQYSPALLRAYIFGTLTGDSLKVLKCTSCGARFSVDMPPSSLGYYCPKCNLSHGIMTDQEETAILKEALAKLKPKVIIVQPVVKQPKPNQTDGNKGGG